MFVCEWRTIGQEIQYISARPCTRISYTYTSICAHLNMIWLYNQKKTTSSPQQLAKQLALQVCRILGSVIWKAHFLSKLAFLCVQKEISTNHQHDPTFHRFIIIHRFIDHPTFTNIIQHDLTGMKSVEQSHPLSSGRWLPGCPAPAWARSGPGPPGPPVPLCSAKSSGEVKPLAWRKISCAPQKKPMDIVRSSSKMVV